MDKVINNITFIMEGNTKKYTRIEKVSTRRSTKIAKSSNAPL